MTPISRPLRIAEDPEILLPVMVCMDGWVLTHSYEPVSAAGPGGGGRLFAPL